MTPIFSDSRASGPPVSIGQMMLCAPKPGATAVAVVSRIVRGEDDDAGNWAKEKGLTSFYYWRRRERECPRDSQLWRDYIRLWTMAAGDGKGWRILGPRGGVTFDE